MLQPGHIAGGYLATKALLAAASFSLTPHQYDVAMVTGVVASVIPDLDLVYFFKKRKSAQLSEDASHRELVSHAPALWLLGGLIAFAASPTEFGRALSLAIIAGSWSHFILDSIEYGIMWLWPFSKTMFSIRNVKQKEPVESSVIKFYWRLFWEVYVKNLTFWFEVAIVIAAFFVYFH